MAAWACWMPIRWFSSVSLRAASAAATPATATCSAARALSRSTCGTALAWASGLRRATSSLAFASAAWRCSSSARARCTSTCSWALASSACALASCARALWRDASYWVRWISKRTWPSLTSAPSSNRTCSRTPWMRARSSTVWTASVCATNSAMIGTVFLTTSATTTAGGGGAGAASLALVRSQVVRAGNSATSASRPSARRDDRGGLRRIRRVQRGLALGLRRRSVINDICDLALGVSWSSDTDVRAPRRVRVGTSRASDTRSIFRGLSRRKGAAPPSSMGRSLPQAVAFHPAWP